MFLFPSILFFLFYISKSNDIINRNTIVKYCNTKKKKKEKNPFELTSAINNKSIITYCKVSVENLSYHV
jgi:hypothetical protein